VHIPGEERWKRMNWLWKDIDEPESRLRIADGDWGAPILAELRRMVGGGGEVSSGLQMSDWWVQWLPEWYLSWGMDKMYLDIHLENTFPWPSLGGHNPTVHNKSVQLPVRKSAEREVGNTAMSLAGAQTHWRWEEIDGKWDQALPFGWTMISYHPRPWGDMHRQTGAPQPGSQAQCQSTSPTGNNG